MSTTLCAFLCELIKPLVKYIPFNFSHAAMTQQTIPVRRLNKKQQIKAVIFPLLFCKFSSFLLACTNLIYRWFGMQLHLTDLQIMLPYKHICLLFTALH